MTRKHSAKYFDPEDKLLEKLYWFNPEDGQKRILVGWFNR